MKILKNEKLDKYTTVRIGGTAETLYIPESTEELIQLIRDKNPKYFIGGGSNLLIAERSFDQVVLLKEFSKEIIDLGDGSFRVGASVRLQKLIKYINDAGYGGIEYLFSVPGLIGGAVVMNAGRGRKFNKCISDYITKIRVLKDNTVIELDKTQCDFSYRNSIFKNNSEIIILEVWFTFPQQSEAESYRLRKERIELCKNVQDNSKPNFGTVFMYADARIMKCVSKLGVHKGNICYSKKTANWMLSDKEGKFKDAVSLIRRVQTIHKVLRKKAIPEVIIWE